MRDSGGFKCVKFNFRTTLFHQSCVLDIKLSLQAISLFLPIFFLTFYLNSTHFELLVIFTIVYITFRKEKKNSINIIYLQTKKWSIHPFNQIVNLTFTVSFHLVYTSSTNPGMKADIHIKTRRSHGTQDGWRHLYTNVCILIDWVMALSLLSFRATSLLFQLRFICICIFLYMCFDVICTYTYS